MAKPPKTTPHSDIAGIHQDERRNVDAAIEAGQSSADLAKAKKESHGRPPYSEEEGEEEDNEG